MPWTDETIETERLRLRPFADRDKPVILELQTSAEVRRYLGGPVDDPALPDLIRAAVVGERPGVFCVADRITDRTTDYAIGSISLDDARGEPEVSYELLPGWWGRGLATEALTAFIGWCWRTGDAPSLIAVTQTANEPSLRLLRRLGFTLEREFVEFGAMQSQLRMRRPGTSTTET